MCCYPNIDLKWVGIKRFLLDLNYSSRRRRKLSDDITLQHSLATRPIYKYVCHFLFTYYYLFSGFFCFCFFFSFTFYFLI